MADKGKITSWYAFLLVISLLFGCLISPILGLQSFQSISSYGTINYPTEWFMEKTVTWKDGLRESIRVDAQGRIFLNGREVIGFGLHIVSTPSNRYDNGDAITKAQLSQLEGWGVRFMAIDLSNWLDIEQCRAMLNHWMPLLHAYKMWVIVNIQHVKEIPPNLNTFYTRIEEIIDAVTNKTYADMIVALGYNWEMDGWSYEPSWDGQLDTFLSQLYPLVREKVDNSLIGRVPLLGKNEASDSDHGTTPIVRWSDFPCWDFYPRADLFPSQADDYMKCIHEITMPKANKTGKRIWFGESGASGPGMNNTLYTPEIFTYLLNGGGYKDVSMLLIWCLEWDTEYGGSAYDISGNPEQWFLNLVPYFPRPS